MASDGLLDVVTASEEIKALFWQYWTANAPAVNGGEVPLVVWENAQEGEEPPKHRPWARVTVQHAGGGQHSLGETGARRFERTGIASVQVFTPLGKGVTLGHRLTKIALDAFEGKSTPGGVWFRDCRVREVGRTELLDGHKALKVLDPWDQTNVVCPFTYDEVK